ncbi:MAG: tRNA (adenosine(37)-N6)-threonylcarbamoyltransferase complex ATPase subunit type 1 TsaE [Kiritimatiellae bacterium]|nr:tRNA (adenosine(37)-N6)-threonylcarbamoyltransferase complex ATPase subunit type 1 TsaE [Kiritimatiellia bacterium]
MTDSFEVNSVEETWELARKFAEGLKPGDVICLEGDLGAGKTTFTQGLAAALGVSGRVTSPTFCIVQEHSGEGKLLVHMDLYRLHGEEDVEAIGWEDYLARGAIMVVEWPERAGSLIPNNAYHIAFRYREGEENRSIRIESGSLAS